MTPVDLLTDRTLYPIDRIIGALLAEHDNGSYCCWPTNAQLASEAGCRERQVQLSLRRLEAAGWIALEPSRHTTRGQIIRLLWRRPPTLVRGGHQGAGGGAHRGAGGGAPRCAPGAHRGAPPLNTRPNKKTQELEPARPQGDPEGPESEVLDPEALAHWQAVAAGGDRTKAKLAGVLLRRHARALEALGGGGSSGGEKKPAGGGL